VHAEVLGGLFKNLDNVDADKAISPRVDVVNITPMALPIAA